MPPRNSQATLNANSEHQVEVFTDQTVEPIVAQEFDKQSQAQLFNVEAFMNEPVEIVLAESNNDNDAPVIVLNVNGVSMPIARGVPVKVKRKYVEVLARCKETKYRQPDRNMANPEGGNELVGATALSYPFEVLHDPNPKGGAWLRAVKLEAA